jgi:hypothetical protein
VGGAIGSVDLTGSTGQQPVERGAGQVEIRKIE